MALTLFKTKDIPFQLMQSAWSSQINPLLKNPSLQNLILPNIALSNGATTINHMLGRMMQGWRIIDINGAATIYRSQPLNSLTLTLTSNAAVTVSLEVF